MVSQSNGDGVLVVDNSPERLDYWCRVLQRVTGTRPRTAASLKTARAALKSGPLNVFVVDLFLTPKSERLAQSQTWLERPEGLELITACREQYPHSRIVAITLGLGKTGKQRAEALDEGADELISAEWPDDYVEQKLRDVLSRSLPRVVRPPLIEVAVDADLMQIVQAQNKNINALHDIILAQQLTSLRVSGEELRPALEKTRARWVGWEDAGRPARIALAVFHGLLEQCLFAELDVRKLSFFGRNVQRVQEQKADAPGLENEARIIGLPVCDSQEQVESVSADFGFVEEIVDHEARVILLDEADRELKSDVTVPLVWLPSAYRREGAGVAWVERRYALGVKGRFEPASAGK